jgi:hypothetical protein
MAVLQIQIKKALTKLAVDTDMITHVPTFAKLVELGLLAALNLKSSKFKDSPKALKETLDNGTEKEKVAAQQAIDAALAQAQKNLEELIAGTFKFGRASGATDASGAKLSREVNTEAMRIARAHVKDWMRSQKIPQSQVPAKTITECAKKMLETNPSIIEDAKAAVAARAKAPVEMPAFDPAALISPELVAKDKARNAERKAKGRDATEKMLSATQAGTIKVKPRPTVTH